MPSPREFRRGRRQVGRRLQRNRERKQTSRERIQSENEKFRAKLDAMPDGLDRKSCP